jgi:hypothetical protein
MEVDFAIALLCMSDILVLVLNDLSCIVKAGVEGIASFQVLLPLVEHPKT